MGVAVVEPSRNPDKFACQRCLRSQFFEQTSGILKRFLPRLRSGKRWQPDVAPLRCPRRFFGRPLGRLVLGVEVAIALDVQRGAAPAVLE
jgi:hypothetical protein